MLDRMNAGLPTSILVLEANLAPTKRNRVRTRLEELGLDVRFVDGGAHPYFELTGEDPALRTLAPESWPGVVQLVTLGSPHPHASRAAGEDELSTPTWVTLDPVVESDAGVSIGPGSFAYLAGPCAVEDAEVTLRLARAVAEAGATGFRAGAFKPRTSPYAFQGLEREGLAILREVRAEIGLPVVTEVLDVRDIEAVAEVADVLQVGSRSMQNYALLKELGRTRHPVLLKRGFAASYEEFLLAAEYILSAGNERVVLCERGVRTTSGSVLDLGAVPELRRRSHLPVVIDPSHGSGQRHRVLPLARAAAAVGADGVLVEVHDRPERALSDGQQAIDPAAFTQLIRECNAVRAALEGDGDGVGRRPDAEEDQPAGVGKDDR
ncbi:MAG: 3-deoxy-7-phosphoheptulonate synthase [Planctomycetota bacterium]